MARHPDRLPGALSERLASAAASIYNRMGREVDVAIGGIPFLLATSQELPQSIETIAVRKDQLDTEADPGEQSLAGWWRRSQASFHEGAGLLWQESSEDNTPSNGFFASEGVDVFTPGKVTLLNSMTTNSALVACTRLRTCATVVRAGTLCRVDGTGSLVTPVTIHAPAAKTVIDGWKSGDRFWSITSDGTLYAGAISSPGTATSWPLGAPLSTGARLMWAKDRLWIIDANKIWQPDLALAASTAQNPIYTSPNPSFTYTSMAPTPGPVLFAGDDGSTGLIQAITLDTDGSLPTLSGATVIAEFPSGEQDLVIEVLAGQYVCIGSNRGIRIGRLDGAQLVYGPLSEMATGCTALASEGRFFLAAFSSDPAQVYRIDTGTEVDEGVFAYAKDIKGVDGTGSTGGVIDSLAVLWDGPTNGQTCGTAQGSLYFETDLPVTSGWIQTGRIRFRTNERKAFKLLNLEAPPLSGTLAVEAITPEGGVFPLGTFSQQGSLPEEALSLASIPPARYISLRFTLAGTYLQAPEFSSYLLRALPAVAPQRLLTLPLMCYDREQARSGQRYGGEGYALDRLSALQVLEDGSSTLVYQDFSRADRAGIPVVIDSVRFIQNSPPTPNARDRAGGIAIVQLRTVEA